MPSLSICLSGLAVALYTSAWIEMKEQYKSITQRRVALYTSAWIEIESMTILDAPCSSRTLHECVD